MADYDPITGKKKKNPFADVVGGVSSTPSPLPNTLARPSSFGLNRPLNYGSLVNGTPTFTNEDIPAAARTEPDAPPTAPIARPVDTASIAQPYDPSGDIAQSQLYREAGLKQIAQGEANSALGSAARALRIDANSYFNPANDPNNRRRSRYPRPDAAGVVQPLIDSVNEGANASVKGALENAANSTALTRASLEDQGATNRENARNAANLQGDQLRVSADLAKPSYQQDANGNLLRVSGIGAAPVLDANGQPVIQRPKVDTAREGLYSKLFTSALAQQAALNGEPDPDAAAETALAGLAKFENRGGTPPSGQQAEGTLTGGATPPPEAAAFLKQNPKLRDQFDAKYGKGAAAKILGS